jgi:hypothetical protein
MFVGWYLSLTANSKELQLCIATSADAKQESDARLGSVQKRVANLGIQLQKKKQIYKLRTHKLASRAVFCFVH